LGIEKEGGASSPGVNLRVNAMGKFISNVAKLLDEEKIKILSGW